MLVSNSKGIVYIFQSCRGKFAGGLNYRGEKGNVTFMQSSQTKCHLPTGLALHGELQIARSAAKQKKKSKDKCIELLCFWEAGNYVLVQAWKECAADLWQGTWRWNVFKATGSSSGPSELWTPHPVPCWISFRSEREEQSDLKPEMMDSVGLARDQTGPRYRSVLMQLLPVWFWQEFLTQK